MPDEYSIQDSSDHDLLIELRTEMRGVRDDIKRFNDDTKLQLGALQGKKLEKDEFSRFLIEDAKSNDDHERRLRFLERWFWTAWGAVTFVEFGIICYLSFFHH
jgi:hypothetical protein